MSSYNLITETPKNVDMFIKLLLNLIQPSPPHNAMQEVKRIQHFSPITHDGRFVDLRDYPRTLEPNVTNYFIRNIEANKGQIDFSHDFMIQAVQLLYKYSYTLSTAQHQLIPQHRYIRRVVDGKFVHEVKYFDYQNETYRWDLASPKYYIYNFHVSVVVYDIDKKIQDQYRGIENLHKIICQSQKRSYLRHLELVGDEPVAFTKKFTQLQRLNYMVDTDDEGELPIKKPKSTFIPVKSLNLYSGVVSYNAGNFRNYTPVPSNDVQLMEIN